MPFQNLYFKVSSFRDHNFNDELDRLAEIPEDYIESQIRGELHQQEPIEPYFDRIIPLTLSPECWGGFIRKNPHLPVTERDYYLSKLFHFIYLPITIAFDLDFNKRDDVRERLEAFLDSIPDSLLPELHRYDWFSFFYQIRSVEDPERGYEEEGLHAVLNSLRKYLPAVIRPPLQAGGSNRIESPAERAKRRQALFAEFSAGRSKASVYRKVGVDKSDFYRWWRGQLADDSVVTERIEKALKGS